MSTDIPTAAAVITAGGSGRRMGADLPKQFLPLGGEPILTRTIRRFTESGLFRRVIAVLPAGHLPRARTLLADHGLADHCLLVAGGASRQQSVANGVAAIDLPCELVAIHDGVRPLVTTATIAACLEAARRHGAAIAAVPMHDTVKKAREGIITATIPRNDLWRAQTPQVFRLSVLRRAYEYAAAQGIEGTDEASLVEEAGLPVAVVEAEERNLKITRPEDLDMAAALLSPPNPRFRIGHGYDAHRFTPGRPLILGGVTIDHDQGLAGHSDADVLCHALCDAILGAAAAGDIGRHFPDTDPAYKGADSVVLLEQVIVMAADRHLSLVNADITVIAQRPKLAPYLAAMGERLAAACRVPPAAINIKATTTEQMGFTGRAEGMACHAVALLSGMV